MSKPEPKIDMKEECVDKARDESIRLTEKHLAEKILTNYR